MTQATLTPTLGQVRAWLAGVGGASADRYFVYHRGFLLFDRGMWVEGEGGDPKWVCAGELDAIATLMWRAHEAGEVILTQRRLAVMDYLYVARRSLKIRRKT